MGKIGEGRAFEKGGAVGAHPVNPFQKVLRKCDGYLDSHKIKDTGVEHLFLHGSYARGTDVVDRLPWSR